ncbi:arginine repressor [Falsarthrobacter nasiphocae]|uniref:Arginine repressor n=1 Tax=Falsarthrobacter nasiphocae TaxID=189863 RepID=A0AAE3YGE8_9MICC|nr:arginine repressor [Falsarthrobacter nasiphocae]MDR6892710.1 transcriptional regulator of arginine metabolism [Falsarthrobacter nasiphocae]
MSIPTTKTARQAHIRTILRERVVRSQSELASLLADDELQVTQATLSRDLVELGAVRVRDGDGALRYQLRDDASGAPSEMGPGVAASRLSKLCAELVETSRASANICLLTTPPGAANFLAQAIDQAALPTVLGTIAGDDTVMVISADPAGGEALAESFLALAES